MTDQLVDHLEVCEKLARGRGQKLIEYFIKMAMLEAKGKKPRDTELLN